MSGNKIPNRLALAFTDAQRQSLQQVVDDCGFADPEAFFHEVISYYVSAVHAVQAGKVIQETDFARKHRDTIWMPGLEHAAIKAGHRKKAASSPSTTKPARPPYLRLITPDNDGSEPQ